MRVISGKARGTKLNTIEEKSTRPTLDRVKESLFNIIQSKVADSNVLDLFAGSGALGIESLSRNANIAYFCEKNHEAVKAIRQNLERTNLLDKAVIVNSDYQECLKKLKEQFDLIFIDPPYKDDIAVKAVDIIINKNILRKDGIIIIETDEIERELLEIKSIENVRVIDQRKYGRAHLIFLKEEN
jgi:16S rRNA (guanine(966)-N(2))-methyltransferase RsmD